MREVGSLQMGAEEGRNGKKGACPAKRTLTILYIVLDNRTITLQVYELPILNMILYNTTKVQHLIL